MGTIHKFRNVLQNGMKERGRERENKTHTHKIIVAKNVRKEREDERDTTTHDTHAKKRRIPVTEFVNGPLGVCVICVMLCASVCVNCV